MTTDGNSAPFATEIDNMMNASEEKMIAVGKRTITMELSAITALSERIDHTFSHACQLMLNCTGRIIVTGIVNLKDWLLTFHGWLLRVCVEICSLPCFL